MKIIHIIEDAQTWTPQQEWTPDSITWWAKYSRNLIFKTPEEAREWVFYKLNYQDKQTFSKIIGKINGPEKNRLTANIAPVYQSGKSWKIGKRIHKNYRLTWKDIEVKPPPEDIDEVAQANGLDDYNLLPLKWYPVAKLVGVEQEDWMYNSGKELQYIKELAMQIKQNRWIRAIIVQVEPGEISILEGQHRARAMKYLGFGSVPGYGIMYHKASMGES